VEEKAVAHPAQLTQPYNKMGDGRTAGWPVPWEQGVMA